MIYVTPSHQDPTGAVMSLERRRQLLAWAKQNQTLIVEDDFDCEYRFSGASIPAIFALSPSDNVVYLSSFWKTLHPLVDTSYMALPAWLAPTIARALAAGAAGYSSSLPMIEQYALTRFVENGFLERHLRRTHPLYRRRLQAAIASLTKCLRKELTIAKESSSTHILLRFADGLNSEEIAQSAVQACLPLVRLRDCYDGDVASQEFSLSFAYCGEIEIDAKIQEFARILSKSSSMRSSAPDVSRDFGNSYSLFVPPEKQTREKQNPYQTRF